MPFTEQQVRKEGRKEGTSSQQHYFANRGRPRAMQDYNQMLMQDHLMTEEILETDDIIVQWWIWELLLSPNSII